MRKVILLCLLAIAGLSLRAQDIPLGTVVGGGITVPDSRTDIPTHYDFLGKGGYRVVKTKAERDTIKLSRRTFNMLVHVNDPACDSTFRLARNPIYPDSLEVAVWVYWLPITNNGTYNMTKGIPPEDYVLVYPYKQVRTPIYFRNPFLTTLYYIRVQCYNDRGTVPYLIVDQQKTYFSLDVAEPCTCSYEAESIN